MQIYSRAGLWWPAILACALGACTAQVNNSALDMQESYKALLMKQILYNLGEAAHKPATFFPSQIVVGGGSAQTTNTISPQLSLPLPGMTTASSFQGATPGGSQQIAWGAPSLQLGLSDSWTLNWALTPQNDPDELQRLRTLYLYATGMIDGGCADEQDTTAHNSKWFKSNYVIQGGRKAANPAFIEYPNCVLCGRPDEDSKDLTQDSADSIPQKDLFLNKNLKCGFISTAQNDHDDFAPFERYGATQFYVRGKSGPTDFLRFTFFVLESVSVAGAGTKVVVQVVAPADTGTPAKPNPKAPAQQTGRPSYGLTPQPPKVQSVTPFSLPL